MNNDELMHYGVLGMRWGKRKAQKSSDNADSSKKIIGNLTKKDVKNIGTRFLGSISIRVASDLAAATTGKIGYQILAIKVQAFLISIMDI